MTSRAQTVHVTAWIAAALLAALPAPASRADELADSLQSIEDLTLLRTLQLDDTQLPQFITAVQGITGLLATQQQQEDAAQEATATAYRQARESLLLGRPIPAEAATQLERAEADAVQRAIDGEQQLHARIDDIRDLLHPRQIELIDWRTAEERAEAKVRPPDPEQAAFFGMALSAIDQVRNLSEFRDWQRLDIAADFLATFLPPGTPDYGRRYRHVVDIFERAMRASLQQYPTARVALAEELLQAVGVARDPAATAQPITREALTAVLARSGTVELLREMLQARLAAPRRR